jgi:hypothetical protein
MARATGKGRHRREINALMIGSVYIHNFYIRHSGEGNVDLMI